MTAPENFLIINQEVNGDVLVKANTQFNHLNADTVIVEEGINTRIYGTIYKLLRIKKDAKVFLHGQLLGQLEEEGGRLYHFDE